MHETFWVVIGTAAPVLGLSALLGIGSTFATSLELQRIADSETSKWKRAVIDAQFMLLRLPYGAAIIAAVIDGVVLALALIALTGSTDPVAPTLVTVLILISFALLWVQAFFAATIHLMPRSKAFVELALRRDERRSAENGNSTSP